MEKFIYIAIAMCLLSGCRYMFAVPPPTTKEYDEAWNKCREKFIEEHKNDHGFNDPNKNWYPIIEPYLEKCLKEQGDPTMIDWYRVLTD